MIKQHGHREDWGDLTIMRKAYSYIRFSTPEQIKGDSLRRQLELSQRYADEHDLEIDTSLTLHDLGLSAFDSSNVERGSLGDFLKAVEVGKVVPGSFLLVESLDRLSRASVMDALARFTALTNAGITIVTLSDGMTYSRESINANWTQLIISLSIMARAHEESAMKSKRGSAAWGEKKRRAGEKVVTSQVPAWLSVIDGKIVLDEAKAETIRMIFRLLRDGFGVHALERKLNSEKVPLISPRADHWYYSYLTKLAHNRALIGEYQPMIGTVGNRRPSGDPVKGYYPAVLTETDFYAVQRVLESRKGKGGRKGTNGVANIFSGLCRCGYCGDTMRYSDKGRGQWMICTKAKAGAGCRYVTWRYDEVENLILSQLASLDIAAILKDDSAQRAKDALGAAQAKLSETRRAISKLVQLAEQVDDVEELQARLTQLRDSRKALESHVKELEAQSVAPELGRKHFEQFRKLRDALDETTGEELKALRLRVSHELKRFIDRIEFYPDGEEPWSYSMHLIGIRPGRQSRFAAVIFKTGDGRILMGEGRGTLWPGPKSEEGVRTASIFPMGRTQPGTADGEINQEAELAGEQ